MSKELRIARETGATAPVDLSLDERLTFERLLADLSARFANVPGDAVESEIERGLRQLIAFLGYERSSFFEFTADGTMITLCSVAVPGVEPVPVGTAFGRELTWYAGELRAGRVVVMPSLPDGLPAEAVAEIEYVTADRHALEPDDPAERRWARARRARFRRIPRHGGMARRSDRPDQDGRRSVRAGDRAQARRCGARGRDGGDQAAQGPSRGRERLPAGCRARDTPGRSREPLAEVQAGAGGGRAGRAHAVHRAAAGRDRQRQGSGRARDPRVSATGAVGRWSRSTARRCLRI